MELQFFQNKTVTTTYVLIEQALHAAKTFKPDHLFDL